MLGKRTRLTGVVSSARIADHPFRCLKRSSWIASQKGHVRLVGPWGVVWVTEKANVTGLPHFVDSCLGHQMSSVQNPVGWWLYRDYTITIYYWMYGGLFHNPIEEDRKPYAYHFCRHGGVRWRCRHRPHQPDSGGAISRRDPHVIEI